MNESSKKLKTYGGVKKSRIFVKEAIRFLMILENSYPELISIEDLKKEFGSRYDGIVLYLHTNRDEEDKLLAGDGKGWTINNYNFDKVQDRISASITEDLVYA